MEYWYHKRQIKWGSWTYHKKEHWSLLCGKGQVERCLSKNYNWKRLQIQILLCKQQSWCKWGGCAPGREVGWQSVWHQMSVRQNHADQTATGRHCPHSIICLYPWNRDWRGPKGMHSMTACKLSSLNYQIKK